MNFFSKLQARFELRRLESRYVTRKKRNTFISDAVYVDGEYVFPGSTSRVTVVPPSPSTSTNSVDAGRRRKRDTWFGNSTGL